MFANAFSGFGANGLSVVNSIDGEQHDSAAEAETPAESHDESGETVAGEPEVTFDEDVVSDEQQNNDDLKNRPKTSSLTRARKHRRNRTMTDITPLSADALATLVEDFEASDHNRMAMNAVTAAGINKVARNYDRARLMQRRFSTIVDNAPPPIRIVPAVAGCSAR